MKSSIVAGVAAPLPEHATSPEPQSTMTHLPDPNLDPSKSQPVWPQNQPNQSAGGGLEQVLGGLGELEPGGFKDRGAGVGENAGPDGVIALVHECECRP